MKKLLLILLLFTSCKIAKRNWVNENFTSKEEKTQLETELQKTKFNLLNLTQNTSSHSNEHVTVTGSITAEDGKEKTVTAGGLTITSNGANINFESTNTSSKSQELIYSQLRAENESFKTRLDVLESKLDQEKTTTTKTVKKTGFQAGVWVVIVLVLLALVVLWYLKNQFFGWMNKNN